jgi:CHAD domain-containing protein
VASLLEPPAMLPAADGPAADVLPAIAAASVARLRKAVRRLPDAPSDDELHRVRIRAKRARGAIALIRPVVGKPAKATSKAIGGLQDVLGAQHDAVVAGGWLRAALPTATRPQAFAIGLLVADQAHRAEVLRSAWRPAWRRVVEAARTGWPG